MVIRRKKLFNQYIYFRNFATEKYPVVIIICKLKGQIEILKVRLFFSKIDENVVLLKLDSVRFGRGKIIFLNKIQLNTYTL